jgi:hypothetical protein
LIGLNSRGAALKQPLHLPRQLWFESESDVAEQKVRLRRFLLPPTSAWGENAAHWLGTFPAENCFINPRLGLEKTLIASKFLSSE